MVMLLDVRAKLLYSSKDFTLQITDVDVKVEKKAKIRNRYNQVPQLSQNTIWESVKNKTQESQEVSRLHGCKEQTR